MLRDLLFFYGSLDRQVIQVLHRTTYVSSTTELYYLRKYTYKEISVEAAVLSNVSPIQNFIAREAYKQTIRSLSTPEIIPEEPEDFTVVSDWWFDHGVEYKYHWSKRIYREATEHRRIKITRHI